MTPFSKQHHQAKTVHALPCPQSARFAQNISSKEEQQLYMLIF
jgi:hypothetical protein